MQARAPLWAWTTHVVVKELHHKGRHAAVDADEEVDASQHHVGRAGHTEDEGGGVHHGGDGPPAEKEPLLLHEETKRGSKDPCPDLTPTLTVMRETERGFHLCGPLSC